MLRVAGGIRRLARDTTRKGKSDGVCEIHRTKYGRSSTGQLYSPAPRRVLSISLVLSRFAPATHQHEYSLFDDISLLALCAPLSARSHTTSPRRLRYILLFTAAAAPIRGIVNL